MSQSRFEYVAYIRTTPEELWSALMDPECTETYWFGIRFESSWEKGTAWRMYVPDGRIANQGAILELETATRLVLTWRHELDAEMTAEGYTRCTIALAPEGDDAVKLTIVHESDLPNSKLIETVSHSWPKVASSLKSFLETGQALPTIHRRVGTCGAVKAAAEVSSPVVRVSA